MATTSRRRTPAKKAQTAPEPEVLEDDLDAVEDADEVEELEELDEAEVSESKPATKKTASKKASDDIIFGVQDLIKLIKTETGKDTDPRSLRTLIRKMARDGSGRVDRVITAGNRSRYNWSGPEDAEVQAIVAAFKAGELDADKKAKLQQLKDRKAAQKAAAKKETAEEAGEVEELDDADEDLDFDDE